MRGAAEWHLAGTGVALIGSHMKTLMRFSYIGILAALTAATGVFADPPAAYKKQASAPVLPKVTASATAAESFLPAPPAAYGYGGQRPTLPKPAVVTGVTAPVNDRAGTWTVPEASTCKANEVATANGCVPGAKPKTDVSPPPNVSAENGQDESAQDKAKPNLDAFTQLLTNKYGAKAASDPNTFYRSEFQNAGGYPMGPATIEQMEGPFCPNQDLDPSKFLNHTCQAGDKDRVTCMVCNMYFEAGNEPDNGQVGVGNTVVTRLYNHGFPKNGESPTTCHIVYDHEKGVAQYSWILESKPHTMTDMKVLTRLVKNAKTALCSKPGTYSNYWAPNAMQPKGSTPAWGPACQGKVTLGSQVFCRFPAEAAVNRSTLDIANAEGVMLGGAPAINISGVPAAN